MRKSAPATAAEWADPSRRPYAPRGAALLLMCCRSREVLMSGPAGTGKTRAGLEKLHLCAEKYPGMRGLILRKTRESLTESALVTWEEKVIPEGHPILTPVHRASRHDYRYPNGSVVVVGGLRHGDRDSRQKVMSTEYDMIFVPEAIELTEDEWEKATTRLRNAVMPYQQLLADTNPDAPTHWLKRRCETARCLMLESRHEDNPSVTLEYLAALDALSGTRRDRLRFGKWVQAEGVVYDGWDAAVHVIDRFPIPRDWRRYWSLDFGFTNPFVCQFWAEDDDGRLYLYREVYRTQRLVEDHARRVLDICGVRGRDWTGALEPRPRAIVGDHDAEDCATFERHTGLKVTKADKSKAAGIQDVAGRLKKAGDGRPRLFVLRSCLDERDQSLHGSRKPCCTAEEFDGYVWDTRTGRRSGEEPIDKDNHGMDAMRYVVRHLDGKPKPGPLAPPTLDARTAADRLPPGVFG